MNKGINFLMEYKGMSIYVDPYVEAGTAFVTKKIGKPDSVIVSEKIGESLKALNRDKIIEDILRNDINDEYELLNVFPTEVFPSKIPFKLTTWDIVSSPGFSTSVRYTIPVGNISSEEAEESVKEMISNYTKDIEWNDTTGEVNLNGPTIPFTKEIWFPEKDPTESPKIEDNLFFPIAMKVAQQTLASELGFASQDELDEVKNRIITENREGSIESIIEDKEHIEKKLEDDEEYKKLMKKGVTPMGTPQGNLMYMDVRYNKDETEE